MNKYKLYDMHIHSHNSHDSESLIEDIANECIKKNISAFAITDHCDIEYFFEHDMRTVIKKSVEECGRFADEFEGRVEILKGIELGEGIWDKEHTMEILEEYDYDVIIGSVHAVRYKDYTEPYSCIDFSEMELTEVEEYLDKYFDEVYEMLQEISCDIMAHLTCPLRYINGKYHLKIDVTKYKEKILKILRYIIDNEIAMEINTSGVCNEAVGFMPDEWILMEFKKMGGKFITFGSDAHVPENVGKDFDKAIELLKKYSFDKYYYYKKREKFFVKFNFNRCKEKVILKIKRNYKKLLIFL